MRIRSLLLALLPMLPASAIAQDFPEPYDTQDPGPGLTAPAEALAGMRLPDGFRATLFAAEPDVRQPIAMATDARGRLWVAENYTYSEAAINYDTDLRDRILILEDTDRDGEADRRTVFWDDGVRLASVEVGFGGVWALCAPYLLFIPDADGDDVPDGDPVVVLDGWNADEIRHNVVNGLRWGPDGWLYGRHGIQATSHVGAPGSADDQRVPMNCGVWRYHPTRKVFEVVCRGTTNPWGMDWDEHGELFFINTVIPHLWHALPGAHFQRMYGEDFDRHLYKLLGQTADHVHWDTRETWNFLAAEGLSPTTDAAGGGHAHSGLLIYQGDDWPEPYRGDVLALNYHGRRINRDHPERAGATYTATHRPDPIAWADPWFRGVELIAGAAGEVYVADWSDIGECHDNDGVYRSSGRIYRITHGDADAPDHGDLATLADAELVGLQSHADGWYARTARRLLQERAAAGRDLGVAIAALDDRLDADGNERDRLRALWCLRSVGATDDDLLIELLSDPGEHVRSWAVRLLVDDGTPSAEATAALGDLAGRESSGLVLTYLASALQRLPIERRWTIAEAIAAHGEFADDPVLPLMTWYGIEAAVPADPDRAATLAAGPRFGPLRRFIARRLTEELADRPEAVAPIVTALTAADAGVRRDLLGGMADALRGLRRVEVPAAWGEAIERLGRDDDPEVLRLARELAVVFGDGRAMDELRGVALDPEADTSARRSAIATLVRSRPDDLTGLLRDLLGVRELAADAVRGLAASDDPATARLLLDRYGRLPRDAKEAAITALAGRPGSAAALIDAIEAGRVDRDDVTPFLVRQMRMLGDEGLADRVASTWPELRPISAEARSRIEAMRAALTADRLADADASRGRALFEKTCAQCHVLFGVGGKVGPELTGSQRGDLGYLLENVIDPNATLADDYRMRIFALADGRVVNGLVAEQADRTLTIQTPTERIVVPRSEIEAERKSDVSLMPEGQLDALDDRQVADLIRYLQSPSQVPLPAGSEPARP